MISVLLLLVVSYRTSGIYKPHVLPLRLGAIVRLLRADCLPLPSMPVLVPVQVPPEYPYERMQPAVFDCPEIEDSRHENGQEQDSRDVRRQDGRQCIRHALLGHL